MSTVLPVVKNEYVYMYIYFDGGKIDINVKLHKRKMADSPLLLLLH